MGQFEKKVCFIFSVPELHGRPPGAGPGLERLRFGPAIPEAGAGQGAEVLLRPLQGPA